MRVLLVPVVLAACSGRTPPPAVAKEPSSGCPAAWQPNGTCHYDNPCMYPEGTCYCGKPPRCSGVMSPDDPKEPTTWQCTPKPPAVRADGCPGVEPDGACSKEGQVCIYGDCCVQTIACTGGHWVRKQMSCPP